MEKSKLPKMESVKELHTATFKNGTYLYAVCESGKCYVGFSNPKKPNKMKWQLVNNPPPTHKGEIIK